MPPKATPKTTLKIVYPSGVKEITDDLGTDELVRRLKACAQAFQSMGQDDDNQDFVPLAQHLANEHFLEHSNKDVRLLVACCIADVFRVYAPEAPYKEPDQLKVIFLFLIKQLKGLEDPKDPAFKRYFYLLENLAWVKSFNICIELEENQEIFCQLFTLMFTIVNDDHSNKVKNFMLDMMCPLISEADAVSQELLDVILSNIIEPRKSQNKNAYSLAKDLLKRTASTIEPYIQAFFNNALILGKTTESDVATHLYDLIYELNSISPSVLLAVLPQLEFKLKSNDEKERLDVTRLLARMFSDKNAELAIQHQSLWSCFLGRFNDISLSVRTRCVQYSMHFLLNHPELRKDVTEQLKLRQHDQEETVRYEVVMAIVSAAKRDFTSISDELLDFVKERTLDKKYKIRKEALLGLSMIYKKCMTNPDIPESTRECISWIKNKVLHVYYQTALEDRLLVERILHTCLVPYQLSTSERMKKLYQLYSTVDDHAVKAFNELLKCQDFVRNQVRSLLEHLREIPSDEREKTMGQKIVVLAKSLPEPVKAQEFIKKLMTVLQADEKLHNYMETILKQNCSCKEAEESVREVLKKLGNPVMTNVFYMTVKQMLERVAPVLIDRAGVIDLIDFVSEAITGQSSIEDIGPIAAERGMKLLYTLSLVFPGAFQVKSIYQQLIENFKSNDEFAAETTLQIFTNVGADIESTDPDIAIILVPLLKDFAQHGSVKQAKYAVRCMVTICRNKSLVFEHTLDELKKNLTLDSPHFRTALVSIGHIAYHCPELFGAQMKVIVSKNVVKELLMQDRDENNSPERWCSEDCLSEETKAKMESMKLMVRWLLGMKTHTASGISTLKLLSTVIMHDGDLMERNRISLAERGWLRLMAGCCVLRLCQEPSYAEIITPEQFVTVALLINDPSEEVREKFAQKLHKGLVSLKLPLDFMAIFALAGNEKNHELKEQVCQFLLANINKRRDYLKQHTLTNEKMFLYLPDYVLPYAIHLLAHDPEFKKFDHLKSLQDIKECLWFLLEPLMTKNENYSFSFFKRLLENIKQTQDAQNPNNEVQNMKLYAVCDLALGLVLSKTTNFVLVEFPVEPTLPKKLFTEIDKTHSNTKMYLPPEMAVTPPKKSGIEMEMYNSKQPQQPTVRRGRPRHGRDAESTRVRRTATNGNTDDGNEEDESSRSAPPSKKSKLAVAEEEIEEEEVEMEDQDPALMTRNTRLHSDSSLVPPENEDEDVSEPESQEKESAKEKENENDNQNNQRPRRSTRDSNRKDDDSQDRDGGGGGRPSVTRTGGGGSTSAKSSQSSSDSKDSNAGKGSEKETGEQQHRKAKALSETNKVRTSTRDKAQDTTSKVATRRSSSSQVDPPRQKRNVTKNEDEPDKTNKRTRSGSQDGKGSTAAKPVLTKSIRTESQVLPKKDKKGPVQKPQSPPTKPVATKNPASTTSKKTNEKEATKSPVRKAALALKEQTAGGRRNTRRAPFANGMDRNLHSDGEESENASPRKSTRIQAKVDTGPDDKVKKTQKKSRR